MSRPRILDEHRLTLEQARAELGTAGELCDFATVYRAVTLGHRMPNGQRRPLEALRVGGRWVTSREAIERYVTAMTEAWTGQQTAETLPTPSKQRSKELAEVDRQLEAAGI